MTIYWKKHKLSPKKWILASRHPEFRRNSALIPANAGLFHYAGNNPVRYIDPAGRLHGLPSDIQKMLLKHAVEQYNLDTYNKIQMCKKGPVTFPFVYAEPDGRNVKYYKENNTGIIRKGGSRSWRNNNPGNIRHSSKQIGSAAGFAIFADYDIGFSEISNLLKSDKYKNLSINDAIFKYAPPTENDTLIYQSLIAEFTGLDTSRIISDLSTEELADVASAIKRIEGYEVGRELPIENVKE